MIYYKIPPLAENLSECFLLVKFKNHKHKINESIHLTDYTNSFLGTYFIINTRTIILKDIEQTTCYLHLNVSKKTYLEIMQYRGFKLNQSVDVLVLSNKNFNYYD